VLWQKTSGFLLEVNKLVLEEKSERISKLLILLVQNGIVELIQKIWQRHLTQELLKQNKTLIQHIHTVLIIIFCTYTVCQKTTLV